MTQDDLEKINREGYVIRERTRKETALYNASVGIENTSTTGQYAT
jgi:hypothetical protein